MNLLKQLFCRHIYKGIDRELLYWKREKDGGTDLIIDYLPTYSNFVYSSLTEKCLKCSKIKISIYRQNIGHQVPNGLLKKQEKTNGSS